MAQAHKPFFFLSSDFVHGYGRGNLTARPPCREAVSPCNFFLYSVRGGGVGMKIRLDQALVIPKIVLHILYSWIFFNIKSHLYFYLYSFFRGWYGGGVTGNIESKDRGLKKVHWWNDQGCCDKLQADIALSKSACVTSSITTSHVAMIFRS